MRQSYRVKVICEVEKNTYFSTNELPTWKSNLFLTDLSFQTTIYYDASLFFVFFATLSTFYTLYNIIRALDIFQTV